MNWAILLTTEWRRWFTNLALVGAGIALTALLVWQTYLIRYRWPRGLEALQITVLGNLAYATTGLVFLVLLAFGMVVVIQSAKARVGPDGISFEAEGHDDDTDHG